MPETPVITPRPLQGDFIYPCDQNCNQDATWAVQVSHGITCPTQGFVCDWCKIRLESSWIDALLEGVRCANCHAEATGQLGDHLHFIRL